MKRLLIITLLFCMSCNFKPDKAEALEFYEQIYSATVESRTKERKLLDDIGVYYSENMQQNNGKVDSARLNTLILDNEKVVDAIVLAKVFILTIPDFEYKLNLKAEADSILSKQLTLHQNVVVQILNCFQDGLMTTEEATELNIMLQEYESVKLAYKVWKAKRKEFCTDFDITVTDLNVIKEKYKKFETEGDAD